MERSCLLAEYFPDYEFRNSGNQGILKFEQETICVAFLILREINNLSLNQCSPIFIGFTGN